MKKKKKFLTILFGLVLALTMFSSNAYATTLELDNDALSNASGYNQFEGNWSYQKGSGMNGDYRIIPSSQMSYAYYSWIYYVSNKTASSYVYLYNINFTNPKAAYQISNNATYVYINQNTALPGWNYLTRVSDFTGAPYFINLNGAMSSNIGNAGADAVKIVY